MTRCIKILVLVAVPIWGMAQQHYPDSLKTVLKNAHADSTRYSALNGIGEYYVEINGDSALNYLRRALAIAEKNNRGINQAATIARIGYATAFKQKYAEALGYFQQALKLAETPAKNDTVWNLNMPWIHNSTPENNRLTTLAAIHLLYSILLEETGDKDQTIAQLIISKAYARQAGDEALEGIVNMNLGVTYAETNRLDSALVLMQSADRVFDKTGYKKYSGGNLGYIGRIYLMKGNDDLALRYFHKGLRVSLEQKTLSLADFNYNGLINYYLAKKQKDSSLYYARKDFEVERALNSPNLDQAYQNLYRSYLLIGNTDSAYKYQGLALEALNKNYESTIKSLNEFQKLSFSAQVHAQELEKEKVDAQTRIRIYVLLTAIALFMLLAGIFYRNNRLKQKANVLLNQQKEEVQNALQRLKTTQNQLIQSEKMASLGELTAGIAHEIQNPLNFVNNFSEVSAEMIDEVDEELTKGDIEEARAIAADVKQNLEKIRHHGKRADSIVKGMLEHSRISTGERQLTDLNTLTDEFLQLSYHGLRAKDKTFNADLIIHFDPSLPKINVVQQDIGRVLLNVINNAFYAVQQKAKSAGANYKSVVEVTTTQQNGSITISVKDNGTGIPENIREKIMQPFFTTKPTGEGTGLGLSLSYDIVVKGHGGNIEVSSKEGEGSEFMVVLPV